MQMKAFLYLSVKKMYNIRGQCIRCTYRSVSGKAVRWRVGGMGLHKIKKAMIFFLIFWMTGCSVLQKDGTSNSENIFNSMEAEPDLSYEVPVSSPNIFVNQLGYITESTKVAVFCGKEMPEDFRVVKKDTGEIVYTGYLEDKGYNEETKEYNSYGDFSEVCEPGTYYLEASIIGRSYSFSIGDDLYDDIFKEACKQYYYNRCGMTLTQEYASERAHNACHTGNALNREDMAVSLDVSGGWHQDETGSKIVEPVAKNIAILLLAYELYEDSFTDDIGIPESGNEIPDILDEIRYETEWLLKMQDEVTGAVYAGVTIYEQSAGRGFTAYVEPADLETTRAFAMVLAKFSYLYQYYDTDYATECLKAADRAWKYAELNGKEEKDGWKFAAAAELYRASGQQTYHKYVTDYLSTEEYGENMDEVVFLGCVTYISMKQPVNFQLCEDITKILMSKAEKVSGKSRNSIYMIGENKEQDNHQELLLDIMYLTMIEHMITNHEYETIIENHLHYLMGRNEMAICYIDNVGENNYRIIDENLGIMNQFDANSKLIFMLSEIVENYRR